MSTTAPDDPDTLARRAREGDRGALDALVRAIQPDVYRLAQRFLMNPADAEDATQEILLKAVTRLAQFDGRSRLKTWLYTLASRHLLDLKKRPSAPTLSFDEFAADLAHGQSAPPYPAPDDARLLEEVRIGCTLALLQCLGPDARLAYILGEILELEQAQACAVLGIGAAAYRKRLARARARVSDFMLANCGLVEPGNLCRCSRRVARASELGRIEADKPRFATCAERARRFPAVLDEIRRLEDTQRAAALYRAQRQPVASADFARWLNDMLARHRDAAPAAPG